MATSVTPAYLKEVYSSIDGFADIADIVITNAIRNAQIAHKVEAFQNSVEDYNYALELFAMMYLTNTIPSLAETVNATTRTVRSKEGDGEEYYSINMGGTNAKFGGFFAGLYDMHMRKCIWTAMTV